MLLRSNIFEAAPTKCKVSAEKKAIISKPCLLDVAEVIRLMSGVLL